MITCPECGFEAADEAKFCDRCGQGLTGATVQSNSSSRPEPLAAGTVLKGKYEILEVIDQDSIENRYRARVTNGNGKTETVRLRERLGPPVEQAPQEAVPAQAPAAPPEEEPSGPRAKTKELKPTPGIMASEAGLDSGATVSSEAADSAGSDENSGALQASEPLAEASAAEEAAVETKAGDNGAGAEALVEEPTPVAQEAPESEDLGEVFGRVLALSLTVNHPAFERAFSGFAEQKRVYLVYPDSELTPLSRRLAAGKLEEPEAISVAVQVCQAVSFMHRRGLRLNDICPESVAFGPDGRVKMTGLDCVTNDNELQEEPIFNDGYTAPEIYRAKKVDKRADIFSAGALLYTMVTGERLESESWREEAGAVNFYPPYVVSPNLEQAIRRALLFSAQERWQTVDEFKAELLKLLGEITIRSATLTDVGMVREHNEDSVMCVEYFRDSMVEPARDFLYVVCDGMGGAEAGEVASAIAVETILRYVEERLERGETKDLQKLLVEALEEANARIIEYQKGHPESRGMGSTGVAALMVPPDCAVAWVGDSRGYVFEGGALRQVTRDHSLVQRLIDIGQITPEQARHHEHKNVITRSLGARQSGLAGAEALALKLRRGQRILLCSDGLTTHVEDDQIAAIMQRNSDPYPAARELIAAANAGGGTDNISVIIVSAV